MQQSYLHVLSSDNNSNKIELTSFMHGYDPGHPPVIAKAYLAGEKGNQQVNETKKNETVIMHDIFGALNY